jgi:hypothetical protein
MQVLHTQRAALSFDESGSPAHVFYDQPSEELSDLRPACDRHTALAEKATIRNRPAADIYALMLSLAYHSIMVASILAPSLGLRRSEVA